MKTQASFSAKRLHTRLRLAIIAATSLLAVGVFSDDTPEDNTEAIDGSRNVEIRPAEEKKNDVSPNLARRGATPRTSSRLVVVDKTQGGRYVMPVPGGTVTDSMVRNMKWMNGIDFVQLYGYKVIDPNLPYPNPLSNDPRAAMNARYGYTDSPGQVSRVSTDGSGALTGTQVSHFDYSTGTFNATDIKLPVPATPVAAAMPPMGPLPSVNAVAAGAPSAGSDAFVSGPPTAAPSQVVAPAALAPVPQPPAVVEPPRYVQNPAPGRSEPVLDLSNADIPPQQELPVPVGIPSSATVWEILPGDIVLITEPMSYTFLDKSPDHPPLIADLTESLPAGAWIKIHDIQSVGEGPDEIKWVIFEARMTDGMLVDPGKPYSWARVSDLARAQGVVQAE